MDLTYTTKSEPKPQPVRVTFDPPLAGYEEVKSRLLAMKADADEALGEVRNHIFLSTATHQYTRARFRK